MPPLSRRSFLQKSALGGSALALPLILPTFARGDAKPNSQITIAVIGLGRGMWFTESYLSRPDVRVLAVCDTLEDRRNKGKATVDAKYGNSECEAYTDFRRILDRRDIDAVAIFTPPHWHAVMAVMAARAGKDVFCEKPMGLTIAEGRAVVTAMEQNKRIFLAGTQWRGIYHDLAENIAKVKAGVIGKVSKIYVGSYTRDWRDPKPITQPPAGLDLNLWIGPSPMVGYYEQLGYWSECRDYSTGWIAEYAVHLLDVAQWGNGTDATGPLEISGVGKYTPAPQLDTAIRFRCEYVFANGVTLICGDEKEDGNGAETPHGTVFVGDRDRFCTTPGTNSAEFVNTKVTPEQLAAVGTREDFFESMRSRRPTYATAETLHRSTSLSILGDIAMRLGRKLKWDPAAERFVNDEEANRYLTRSFRSPWRI